MNHARATRIKFCGLTRRADIGRAVSLGVDCIGFVFATRSPRRLSLDAGSEEHDAVPSEMDLVDFMMDIAGVDVS